MTDSTRDPSPAVAPPSDPLASTTVRPKRGSVPGAELGRGEIRHERTVGWRSRDVVRAVSLVAAMYLGLQLIWFAHQLFLATFLGVVFAIAVSAGVDKLERFRIPRGVGAALIVLMFLGSLGGIGALMAPTLREQGAELRQQLPEAIERVENWFARKNTGFIGMVVGGGAARPATQGPAPAPAASSVGGAPRAAAPADSAGPPNTVRARIERGLSGASRYLFPFLTSTVHAVAGVILIVFLSIYFAAEPDLYRRGFLALLPARRRERGHQVLDRIATVLRKWLVTQLIAMAAIATVTTIGLLILDVKAAFALGLLAGLFEFIPTVGPLLSAIPGIAMAFLDSPEKALYVAFMYWGVQFLENHILIPLLMKGGMDLPPALTVLAQALLALVFGFLGLMVAVPMLAVIMVTIQMLYVEQLPKRGTWTFRAITNTDEFAEARPPSP